jgi:hypothetical protein
MTCCKAPFACMRPERNQRGLFRFGHSIIYSRCSYMKPEQITQTGYEKPSKKENCLHGKGNILKSLWFSYRCHLNNLNFHSGLTLSRSHVNESLHCIFTVLLYIYRGYYTATRRYTTFYLRVAKTIFYKRALRVSKILFLTREDKKSYLEANV